MKTRDEALRQLLHAAGSTTLGLSALAQLLDNALAPSETKARQHVGMLSRAAVDLEATLARARSLLRPGRAPATVALAPFVRDAFALVYQTPAELPEARVIADGEALSLFLAELVTLLARDGDVVQVRSVVEGDRLVLTFSSLAPPPAELTETIVLCLAERAGVACKLSADPESGTMGRIELRHERA
jgi:hypothetical protein